MRQKIIRDTQGSRKLELKALKELVSEFLSVKTRGRKALSMKKLKQPQLDLSLPGGLATVGLAEAAEASEISAIIEHKGFYKNLNLSTTNVDAPELSGNKSLKVLKTTEDKPQNDGRVNSRFDLIDPAKKRFIDRLEVLKDDYINVMQKLTTAAKEAASRGIVKPSQQQLHFQILKCREMQYELDAAD